MNTTSACNPANDGAERFDDALGYNTLFGAYKLSVIAERVFQISDMNSTKNVLEVASGTGELAIRYAKRSKEVTCTDINDYMVDIAKRKAEDLQIKNMKFAVADALKLPFNENTFDIVVERNLQLIYHKRSLENGTVQKVLEEMKRASRDKVIIIHENKCLLQFFKQRDTSFHYFVGKELKRILEGIGLDYVKLRYVTHSTPLLFNLFGEAKLKRIEKIIQNIPPLKGFGGSLIACGSKMRNKN